MAKAAQKCVFCEIISGQKDKHLKESDNAIVIKDASPHVKHHYLIVTKLHVDKLDDLSAEDIPLVQEMERLGRDYLREVLKQTGEADTVEADLRMGFHCLWMISVHHVHMHLLYPVHQLKMIDRMVTFRPSKFFRLTKSVIESLERVAKNSGDGSAVHQLAGHSNE